MKKNNFFIHRIICLPFSSNTYIVGSSNSKEVIIIDNGESNSNQLLTWLKNNNKIPIALFLTHEHFDHCAGINSLTKAYDFQIFTSTDCCELIKTERGNLSAYTADLCEPFKIENKVISITDFQQLKLGDYVFTCIETPGHSRGGLCIQTNNWLFSGDTILETKVPVKLPGSDKQILLKSLQKLYSFCDPTIIIYPGHGEPFKLSQHTNQSLYNK